MDRAWRNVLPSAAVDLRFSHDLFKERKGSGPAIPTAATVTSPDSMRVLLSVGIYPSTPRRKTPEILRSAILWLWAQGASAPPLGFGLDLSSEFPYHLCDSIVDDSEIEF